MMGQISKNANSQETIWCSFSGSGVDDIIIKLCAKGIFILSSYLYRRKMRTKEYLSMEENTSNRFGYRRSNSRFRRDVQEKNECKNQESDDRKVTDTFLNGQAHELIPVSEEKNVKVDERKDSLAETQNVSVPARPKKPKRLYTGTDIIYNPLSLPELFEQYDSKLLNKAFETLYKQGNDKFFQCTPQEFRYWLGGTMGTDFKADEVGCRRIKWKKGKHALQYFMVRLYLVKRKRMPRDMWDKIANIFVIDNLPIQSGELGKNVDKVGKEDKQKIDEIIKLFNKGMKKT